MTISRCFDIDKNKEIPHQASSCIKDINYSLLFGLIILSLQVRDSCPEIESFEAKFKTQIKLRFFSFILYFTTYSVIAPILIVVNGAKK